MRTVKLPERSKEQHSEDEETYQLNISIEPGHPFLPLPGGDSSRRHLQEHTGHIIPHGPSAKNKGQISPWLSNSTAVATFCVKAFNARHAYELLKRAFHEDDERPLQSSRKLFPDPKNIE